MVTYILIAAVAIVVVLLAVVAMQPSEFRVERKAVISAPPADVFASVADLHKWRDWSPWERVDPEMKRTYSGPDAGNGASYAWLGNRNVGEGRMTITECRPNEIIRIRLEFLKPFACTNTAEFNFAPQGNGQTTVTWSMYGPKNLFAKAFHLCVSMDRMIGREFEKGLANLKSVVTAAPATASTT